MVEDARERDHDRCRVVGLGEPGAFRALALSNRATHPVLSHGVCISDRMPPLRRGDFTREHLEMPLRIHHGIASVAALPDLRIAATYGPVLLVRCHGTVAGVMRLTARDIEMLALLRAARWLTTSQIHRRYFAKATMSAARRRLRLLGRAGYLRKVQENPMREALYTLGRGGKHVLEVRDGE